MLRLITVLFLVLLFYSDAVGQIIERPERTVWSGYRVYNAGFRHFFNKTNKPVVIQDSLVLDAYSNEFVKALESNDTILINKYIDINKLDEKSVDAIISYYHNQDLKKLDGKHFAEAFKITVAPKRLIDEIFNCTNSNSWGKFYSTFPRKSKLIKLSNAFLSSERGVFYMSIEEINTNSIGYLVIINKVGINWELQHKITLWKL